MQDLRFAPLIFKTYIELLNLWHNLTKCARTINAGLAGAKLKTKQNEKDCYFTDVGVLASGIALYGPN